MVLGQEPVPELDNQLRQVLKYSGLIMSAVFLALYFYPGDTVLWGMVLGIAVGMYNSVTLVKRIKKLPDLNNMDKARKYMKRGMYLRLILIMAVLFLVVKRITYISIFGVGAGLLIPSCVSSLLSLLKTMKLYKESRAVLKKYYGE